LRNKNHNLWINLNTAYAKASEEVGVYIFYYYGSGNGRKKRIPNLKVPFGYWDSKEKFFKKSAVNKKLISSDDVEYVNVIKAKLRTAERKIAEGSLTVDNAFRFLLKQQEDDTLYNHLQEENGKAYSPNAAKKYIYYLNGIEKHLPSEYTPLKFSNIQDPESIKNIAKILKQAPIKSNTVNDYLSALDTITVRANLSLSKPFSYNKLIPSLEPTIEKNVPYEKLMNGINNINTKQDYLAYAFWLLSFHLRGLDGIDIVNMDENTIEGDYTLPYYPSWDSDNCFVSCNEKAYYIKQRGKSNVHYRILMNLYPTYYLHKLVKSLIKETHPEYAYKGSDKIRIFNFLTKDKYNRDDIKGRKKWDAFRDTVFKKSKKLIGEGIKASRNTFINLAKNEVILTDSHQQDLLQHSTGTKKALNHYQSENQLTTDLNHIFILQEYNTVQIVDHLFQLGHHKGYLNFKQTEGSKTLLERYQMNAISPAEETEYQKLLREYNSKPVYKFENGKNVMQPATKSARLKELEEKRYNETLKHYGRIVDLTVTDEPSDNVNYMLESSELEGIKIWHKKNDELLIKLGIKS